MESVAKRSSSSMSEKKARTPCSARGEASSRSTCRSSPSGVSSSPDSAASRSRWSGALSQRKKLRRDARDQASRRSRSGAAGSGSLRSTRNRNSGATSIPASAARSPA